MSHSVQEIRVAPHDEMKSLGRGSSICLVWNGSARLVDITTRYEPYVIGLRECGCDVVTICPRGLEVGYPFRTITFDSPDELLQLEFWQRLGCDAGLIISWHRMTDVIQAMSEAGLRVINVAESDGQVSLRQHPWATLRFMAYNQHGWRRRVGAVKYWLQRLLTTANKEDQALIENVRAARITTFANTASVQIFKQFLRKSGAEPSLLDRVCWLPYPVDPIFIERPVTNQRRDKIVSIGRWDSAQKNAPLLVSTVKRLAIQLPHTEFVIIGRTATQLFEAISQRYPNIHTHEHLPRERLCGELATARCLLITSRWESGPIVAYEALTQGCSIVSTPLHTLRGMIGQNEFGRVATRADSRTLAETVLRELAAWEQGERNATEIAATWREMVAPIAVAKRLMSYLSISESRQECLMQSGWA